MQSIRRITVGARSSPLSKSQVKEVYSEIHLLFPDIVFDCYYVQTKGDKDQKTSLREMEKTDFFTKEIDEMLLRKKCRIAIHSAKDLPEDLPKSLTIAAITQGVSSSDSLVFRVGENLKTLLPNSIIATSSDRREKMVRSLRQDLIFKDIRGNIGKRLQELHSKKIDGVVIAEAALIRLDLVYLHRVKLPGKTNPMQGRLAVVIHEKDRDMEELFSLIDTRKTV